MVTVHWRLFSSLAVIPAKAGIQIRRSRPAVRFLIPEICPSCRRLMQAASRSASPSKNKPLPSEIGAIPAEDTICCMTIHFEGLFIKFH